VIVLDAVGMRYEPGGVCALRDVSLRVDPGELVSIHGGPQSGKSTLIGIIGGLDQPTEGRCLLDGTELGGADDRQLARTRNRLVGFVLPDGGLIGHLTVAENVELPLAYAGDGRRRDRRMRVLAALAEVGLEGRDSEPAAELSDTDQRRAAIARALVHTTPIVLADDPTAGLDGDEARAVIDLLSRLHRDGRTVVVATSDPAVAARATRRLRLVDGTLVAAPRRAPRRSAPSRPTRPA
jgi:putative ABC transport system ATP-binding protein